MKTRLRRVIRKSPMTALPFAPRRRGTALLTVLLGLAQAVGDRTSAGTGGSGKAGAAAEPEVGAAGSSGRAPGAG